MKVSIIKIGNSRGLRISKTILDRYNIKEHVEIILDKGQIILRPVNEPRQGWDAAFEKMHETGDDKLLIDDVFEDEHLDEWS